MVTYQERSVDIHPPMFRTILLVLVSGLIVVGTQDLGAQPSIDRTRAGAVAGLKYPNSRASAVLRDTATFARDNAQVADSHDDYSVRKAVLLTVLVLAVAVAVFGLHQLRED